MRAMVAVLAASLLFAPLPASAQTTSKPQDSQQPIPLFASLNSRSLPSLSDTASRGGLGVFDRRLEHATC
jgi:hypothetical protein